jgi:hypothetical protein
MENVKSFISTQFSEFTANPTDKIINFAGNVLGSAVVIWFASVILGFSMRIIAASYNILSSAF